MRIPFAISLFAAAMFAAPTTHAAESYDGCAGFITTLPATVSTQGVFCLQSDLATTIASGNAIVVTAPNVTIDCNEFKIGGLGAGATTQATAIFSTASNVGVRGCNIRGFRTAVDLRGPGVLVENNRLEGNTVYGVYLYGGGGIVRGNRIVDTGESTLNLPQQPMAIYTNAQSEIRGNVIYGVIATPGSNNPVYAIRVTGDDTNVVDNSIGGLIANGTGTVHGIYSSNNQRAVIAGNRVVATELTGTGLRCNTGSNVSVDNVVLGFSTPVQTCPDGGGNWYD